MYQKVGMYIPYPPLHIWTYYAFVPFEPNEEMSQADSSRYPIGAPAGADTIIGRYSTSSQT